MHSLKSRNPKLLLALLICLLLGFALRMIHLNTPIWGDEVATWAFSRRTPFDKMIHFSLHDPTPPLYYALVHLVLPFFGSSYVALRWLSVLPGLLILPVTYWHLKQAHFPIRDRLLAVLLTAVSSMLIFYSQEARAYALLALLGLLSTGFLWRSIQKPTLANSAILTFLVIIMAYTHRSALFLVVAQIGLLFLYRRWRPFIFTLTAFILIILTIFLQMATGTFSFGQAGDPTNSEAVISLISTVTAGSVGMQHISKLPGRLGLAFPNPLINQMLPVVGVAVLIILLVIGLKKFIHQKKLSELSEQHQYILMLWFCILVPVTLGLLAGSPLSPTPQWLLRGLIYVVPLYFLALVATTSQSKIQPVLVLTLVLLNGLSLYPYYTQYTRFNDEPVFEQLSTLADENDLIIADPWYMFEVVNYYYEGQAAKAGYDKEEGWVDVIEMAQTFEPGLMLLDQPPAANDQIFVYFRDTNLAWSDYFPDKDVFVYERSSKSWQLYNSQSP